MNGPLVAAGSDQAASQRECRVYQRFPSDASVNCQPPAARGADEVKWPARIRNVSSGGLSLVLRRRFEPGAGLAIELPGADATPLSTLYVRVVHVMSETGGLWALGCKFVSPLGEDELQPLLLPRPAQPGRERVSAATCLTEIYFRAVFPGGGVVERVIKNLTVKDLWPLPAGRIIGISFCNAAGHTSAVKVRVHDCHFSDGCWNLECAFVGSIPADLPCDPSVTA